MLRHLVHGADSSRDLLDGGRLLAALMSDRLEQTVVAADRIQHGLEPAGGFTNKFEPESTSPALCSIALTSADAWAATTHFDGYYRKPLPASPARAASTETLSASRLV